MDTLTHNILFTPAVPSLETDSQENYYAVAQGMLYVE